MNKTQNFTEGKIFAPLIRFALPVLLALFLQTMYGAVDLLVVGQFGTAADVSAVSTGSMVMQTVTVVITGLSMGLTVLVGRKIGEGFKEEAGKIIGTGIWLFAILAVVLSAVMVFAAPAMARLMQAPEEAFGETVTYITICSAGAVFIVAYNLVGSIFRGIGDSTMPLVTVAIACGLNILGDLLLVAVFHMGTAGAAIATVFAQAVSVALSLVIIRKKGLPFTVSTRDIRPQSEHIRQILFLGIPIALQDLLVSISFLAITAIVNGLGLTVSAGVGVAEKLCGFVMLVPSAYMQAMSAFVAQNMGAGKPERARKALLCGIASSLVVGAVMAYLTFFHGDILSGCFARDAVVIAASAEYLKAYAIDCLLVSFLFCFIGYFNGTGSTLFVMLQGIIGAFGVRLPVSWLVSQQATATLFQIGLATPASSLVQILLCGAYFAFELYRQKRKSDCVPQDSVVQSQQADNRRRHGMKLRRIAISIVLVLLAVILVACVVFFWHYPHYVNQKAARDIQPDAEGVRMMSYNLRCLSPLDLGQRSWYNRADLILDDIEAQAPGIIGFQEATRWQYDYLVDTLPGYDSVITYRDEAIIAEGCPIFYNTSLYTLVDKGSFWLSETPEVMSRDWGAAHYRICSYVILTDNQAGTDFVVFNTHLDHVSDEARIKGIEVVLDKIAQFGGLPAVIMGDFNAVEGSETYNAVTQHFLDACRVMDNGTDTYTFQGWGEEPYPRRIDFFMISKTGFEIADYQVLSPIHDGVYSSDHCPIMLDVTLN